MKTRSIVILALLLSLEAFSQNTNSIYNKYSDMPGVNAVYISPAMFNMMQSLPDITIKKDVNIEGVDIIKSFNGMYLLDFDNNTDNNLKKSLSLDIENFINKGKYLLMMEAKEDGETIRMYVSKKGNIITEFILFVNGQENCCFISITGNLSEEALNKIVAKAMQ